MEFVKQFCLHWDISSVKQRVELIENIKQFVTTKKDIADGVIKLLTKSLTLTLPLYKDLLSRKCVAELIECLLTAYPKPSQLVLMQVLNNEAKNQTGNKNSSRSQSGQSLAALGWSLLLGRVSEDVKKVANIQAALYYGAQASQHAAISKSANRKIEGFWKKNPKMVSIMVEMFLGEEASPQGCLLVAKMLDNHRGALEGRMSEVLAMFVKIVVASKTPPTAAELKCAIPIIKEITHNDFKDIILPAFQKTLLRSPDNVLTTIENIAGNAAIDLSRHSLQLVRMLSPQLISKNDGNRGTACGAVVTMAVQCSDAQAVSDVLKYLFAVLKGSEGKLTTPGQKYSILTVIGGFASSPVGSGQSACELNLSAVQMFLPFLQTEVHEGTLVQAGASLSKWCQKLKNQVPTELVNWFVKAPSLKPSTSAVRSGYLDAMSNTFKRDSLVQVEPLISYLLQCVDKATAFQVPMVTEALYASSLVARLENVEFKKAYKWQSFWNSVLKRDLFTSDKFLHNSNDETLLKLNSFVEYLFLEHPQKLQSDNIKSFCRCLIYMMLNKGYLVRKSVTKTIKKLQLSLPDNQFCFVMLEIFSTILRPSKYVDLEAIDDITELMKTYVTPRRFHDVIQAIIDVPELNKNGGTKITLAILEDAYHPCILPVNNHLLIDFLYKNHIDAREFIRDNLGEIKQKLIHNECHTGATLAALSDLVRIAPDILMPVVVKHAASTLGIPELNTITRTEYNIMLTPEGQLYNLAVIDRAPKIAENKSIKRESKAYSYKEQIMGEELKREFKRKGDSGGTQGGGLNPAPQIPPNLNKKQRELYDLELEKEKVVRGRLLKLNSKFNSMCDVLFSSVKQHRLTSDLSCHLVGLIKPLLSSLSSPLASKRCQDLFVFFNDIFVPDDFKQIGLQSSYAALRMFQPSTDVDEEWCREPLGGTVERIVTALSKQLRSRPQTPAFFAFVLPFLRRLLDGTGSVVDGNVELMTSALQIVLSHVKSDDAANIVPREDVLRTMTQLIGTSLVQVQIQAQNVLLATCQAGTKIQGPSSCSEIKVLLEALLSPVATLRGTALKGLQILSEVIRGSTLRSEVMHRVWVAKHDVDEVNRGLADDLWSELEYQVDTSLLDNILADIQYHEPAIQNSASQALKGVLTLYPGKVPGILTQLIGLYNEKLEMLPPVLDHLGRVIRESPPDDSQPRLGVSLSLLQLSPLLPGGEVRRLFSFFVPDALGDRNPEVRSLMLDAALQAVNDHGKECTEQLLPVFEDFLKNAPTSERYDTIRQSVVVLLGTLARHLEKDNPKVKPIVAKLTETLSTPSQEVQEAVANCLPALVPSIKKDAPAIVKKLLLILTESEKYGERKGAAYGLAGMVKGLGIVSFKQLDIMATLTDAVQNKKNFRQREGALMAFEMFCGMLGRLFEPYIVHVLPHLLLCFGDGNQYVREAADNTARAVMRNLSAHGVRMVLPSLLKALNTEDSWRTKTGSAELLGAMAFCAPKQLSACLPSIVPKLCEVLTDSHPKVQKAGQQALKQIGSVIRNPEILAISDVLLAALSNPSQKTSKCLQTLLDTKFIHFIDAPSLALVLPVVQRAFLDRSTDTRKMAAQIIGNMYSLTDQKDLEPYLPGIVPGLKNTLLDPVPEVRGIAAKALGAMIRGTGESQFEELLPWLMEKLTSEQSSVDRSGAAQGLSEMLSSFGRSKLSNLLPDIIKTANSDNILPHVRDGYIMLFVYLPHTFGDDFVPYIGDVLKPILHALADESEFVRETALCAGQRIISMFAETAIEVLLPQIERGLFDNNWRIRLSSIQLLGDLLYHITGVTGKMSSTGAEDDNFGTQEGFKALIETLGQERRDLVLSGLYMGRCDVALNVRHSALHVWKIVVPNTPRILREILPTLFKLLLGCLASHDYDKRQIAAKTLGDIVRKLGERMLPELIPILEKGLDSEDVAQRQGVCIGLTEIIKSCSKDAIIGFTDNLVPTVQTALCDTQSEVRMAAATTFEHLHSTIGVQALDEILPTLLRQLENEETAESAVDGLRQIISVKGRVVLPFIVPKLIEPPVNTEVLAYLSSVAGEALTKHLPVILKALLQALVDVHGSGDEFVSILADATKVVLSVEGDHGARIVTDDLLAGIKSTDVATRRASISLLQAYCESSESEFQDYVPVFYQAFLKLLADESTDIQTSAWKALSAVTNSLDPIDMQRHVSSVRHALRYVKNEDVVLKTGALPGFCLPKKGMSPILPVFREGLLNGSPELKEHSAKGLGECIQLLTAAALKPSVVNITGPLIRILGDRFSSNVRIAVLETLSLLLQRVGVFLKPFLPQLQTTFCKALQDNNREVRLQAGIALSKLASIHTRIDPLFTDINNNIHTLEDVSFRETMLQALRGCIQNGGKKMKEAIKEDLILTLSDQLESDEDSCLKASAGCLGCLCQFMSDGQISNLFILTVFANDGTTSWKVKEGRSSLLAAALKEACPAVLTDQWEARILDKILSYATVDRVQLATNGTHAAAYLLIHYINEDAATPSQVVEIFKKGFENTSNDVKVETMKSLCWVMQQTTDNEPNNLPDKISNVFLPMILNLTREKNTTVRSSAESCLVAVLRLHQSEQLLQEALPNLSTRDSNSLQDLFKQKLKKLSSSPITFEEIDDTVITY